MIRPSFSPNPWTDLTTMWSYPYLRNALLAGSIVAVIASSVGWMMVQRRQSFLGHTLAVVSFPGACLALLFTLPASIGYYGATFIAALIARQSSDAQVADDRRSNATVGTVQAVALAIGLLVISHSSSFLTSTTSLLFGSFLGITTGEVLLLAVVGVATGAVFIAIARPLLLATFDATEARAMGIPVDTLNVMFVVLLALVVAATSQITGALLDFALLVMPGATAQTLTPKVWRGCAIAVALGLLTIWLGIGLSFFLPRLPLGFCVTSVGFTAYVVAQVLVALRSRPHVQGVLA